MKTRNHRHTDAHPLMRPLIIIGLLCATGIFMLVQTSISMTHQNEKASATEHLIYISIKSYGFRLADSVDKPQLVIDCYAENKVKIDVVSLATSTENKVVTMQCQIKGDTYEAIITDIAAK